MATLWWRVRHDSRSRHDFILCPAHDFTSDISVAGNGSMNAPIELACHLTCPHCGRVSIETMPTNACIYFHDCSGCGELLRPKPGDCCVFCSYGSISCPPVQAGHCCAE
jgi:hypothetical protein